MSYVSNFISNFNSRSVYKGSCTKSGLVPMKVLTVCVNVTRFLGIYNAIYTISLVLTNIINRKKLIKFYSQFITKDDLCFDIGANIGSRTEVFLRLGAKVVSVEPARRTAGGSVISTVRRNLLFSACYIDKISRSARNDMLLRLFTKPSNIEEKKRDEMCNRGFKNRKGGTK